MRGGAGRGDHGMTGVPSRSVEVRVINLARAQARRDLMQAQFDRLGIAARFQDAVDGSLPGNAARLAALPDTGPWGAVHWHAKGCTLSHFDALRDFLAGGATHAVILEDDVFLSDDLPGWLSDLGWWPQDADLVKLERWRDDRLYLVLAKAARAHAGRLLPRLWSRHSGTGGYMVTRAAAQAILSVDRPAMPIDHLLFNVNISPLARRLRTYQVVPALVVQGNDPVTAAPQTLPTPTKRPLSQELRRAWHEIKVAPGQLALVLSGRARLARIGWQNQLAIAATTPSPLKD